MELLQTNPPMTSSLGLGGRSSSRRRWTAVPGVAEPFAVKCFIGELTCISLMAMEIHFSDTGGRRESVEQIDPGPSLEEIIRSMQQHLRCSATASGEGSDVVYARSRGNGTDGLCGGVESTRGGVTVTDTSLLSQTVYTAPWTYDSATDGIYGDNDASECEEIPLPVLTREMLRRHTNAENEYANTRSMDRVKLQVSEILVTSGGWSPHQYVICTEIQRLQYKTSYEQHEVNVVCVVREV